MLNAKLYLVLGVEFWVLDFGLVFKIEFRFSTIKTGLMKFWFFGISPSREKYRKIYTPILKHWNFGIGACFGFRY